MEFYNLELCGLERRLPIVSLGPKVKIASFNLLGDVEMVKVAAQALVEKLRGLEFDFLVGPEVKVVPLLQELSTLLGKRRYILCRKNVRGYMVEPSVSRTKPQLVLDGPDRGRLQGKKVVVVDDVITTGRTLEVIKALMQEAGAEVVGVATVLKQSGDSGGLEKGLIFLGKLPVFPS